MDIVLHFFIVLLRRFLLTFLPSLHRMTSIHSVCESCAACNVGDHGTLPTFSFLIFSAAALRICVVTAMRASICGFIWAMESPQFCACFTCLAHSRISYLMYAFITLLLYAPRTRGSLTATGVASTPCVCGGLFPKISLNGVSIHSVRWSPGVPSSNARYPACILSLVSSVVMIASSDASHYQLGAVVSQDGKQIAFFSRKLNPAQTRYTTTERELLSIIVETLKEYRNILLGQEIEVFTDHKNLVYKHFNKEQVV